MSPFIDAAAATGRSNPVPRDTLDLPSVASPDAPRLYNWTNVNERGYQINEEPMGTKRPMKIIVLGAGASGINFLKTAQDRLENVELVCYEKNKNVGGTWLENTCVFSYKKKQEEVTMATPSHLTASLQIPGCCLRHPLCFLSVHLEAPYLARVLLLWYRDLEVFEGNS
jgi:hypothetical protein